jgi:hypothetical protein
MTEPAADSGRADIRLPQLPKYEMDALERLASRGFEALVFLLACATILLLALIVLYAYETDDLSRGFLWLAGGVVAGFLALCAFVVAHVYPTPSIEAFSLATAGALKDMAQKIIERVLDRR